jgi:polar amino acid transport system permease protein
MDIFLKYYSVLLKASLTTAELFIIVALSGLLLGLALALVMLMFKEKFNRFLLAILTISFSCPILVLMHWAYFPLQTDWSVKLNPFWTGVLVLSLLNAAMMADVFYRDGKILKSDFENQRQIFNISYYVYLKKIFLPSLFVKSLPSLLLIQLSMLHATLFAGLIGAEELFRTALRINSVEINGTLIFTVMALLFIVLSVPFHVAANIARNKSKKVLN